MKTQSSNRQNIVGPGVRKVRIERGWTQMELSARLRRVGARSSRGNVAKIEARLVCVSDGDLLYLCKAFKVGPEDLYSAASLEDQSQD